MSALKQLSEQSLSKESGAKDTMAKAISARKLKLASSNGVMAISPGIEIFEL